MRSDPAPFKPRGCAYSYPKAAYSAINAWRGPFVDAECLIAGRCGGRERSVGVEGASAGQRPHEVGQRKGRAMHVAVVVLEVPQGALGDAPVHFLRRQR